MSRAVVIIGALFLQHCYHPRAQAASGLLCCEAGAGQYHCKARAGRCMTPATLPRGGHYQQQGKLPALQGAAACIHGCSRTDIANKKSLAELPSRAMGQPCTQDSCLPCMPAANISSPGSACHGPHSRQGTSSWPQVGSHHTQRASANLSTVHECHLQKMGSAVQASLKPDSSATHWCKPCKTLRHC